MKTCRLVVEIDYDPEATDPEALAAMMDHFYQAVSNTFDVGEDYGDPVVHEFFVASYDVDEDEEAE